jgi:pimeloyl-ACP methyl ester carboxylesterase
LAYIEPSWAAQVSGPPLLFAPPLPIAIEFALVLISVEDIEDDEAKQAEIAFMDAFANRVRTQGIEAAWEPILRDLPPVIGAMVRDAIPRSNPASIAAAAAIGRDRSFRNVEELAVITAPTLIILGADWRHPAALAEKMARVLSQGCVVKVESMAELQSADDLARAYAPLVQEFLTELRG